MHFNDRPVGPAAGSQRKSHWPVGPAAGSERVKKPNLDQNELKNYRPVSNLSFCQK